MIVLYHEDHDVLVIYYEDDRMNICREMVISTGDSVKHISILHDMKEVLVLAREHGYIVIHNDYE